MYVDGYIPDIEPPNLAMLSTSWCLPMEDLWLRQLDALASLKPPDGELLDLPTLAHQGDGSHG